MVVIVVLIGVRVVCTHGQRTKRPKVITSIFIVMILGLSSLCMWYDDDCHGNGADVATTMVDVAVVEILLLSWSLLLLLILLSIIVIVIAFVIIIDVVIVTAVN